MRFSGVVAIVGALLGCVVGGAANPSEEWLAWFDPEQDGAIAVRPPEGTVPVTFDFGRKTVRIGERAEVRPDLFDHFGAGEGLSPWVDAGGFQLLRLGEPLGEKGVHLLFIHLRRCVISRSRKGGILVAHAVFNSKKLEYLKQNASILM